MNYKNIAIGKDMYKAAAGFVNRLEELDPSESYKGSALDGLDAYERQLKRFDIRVKGGASDMLEKFFKTSDSCVLFPEYVARAVRQGATENNLLQSIIASKTNINSMDYRTIATDETADDRALKIVAEGGVIPQTTIKLKENLVRLVKRGRLLVASYEALRFQRLDLFTVALGRIGNAIAAAQMKDAVDVLMTGDGGKDAAQVVQTAAAGVVTYQDLIALWSLFDTYEMNTLLVSPDMMTKLLGIEELQNPLTGLNFQGTGKLATPLGATLMKSSAVPAGTIIGLDKRFALEMVSAGDISVDYDKLIDCQLERAAITSITGFSKIFPEAVKVLKLKA